MAELPYVFNAADTPRPSGLDAGIGARKDFAVTRHCGFWTAEHTTP